MIILGGLTRLTGSGLSIVEWKPFIGILPPLTNNDWQIAFQAYQNSPEFQKVNFGFTLGDFKSIFWLEYLHRLWGRFLALTLIIPTIYTFLYPIIRQGFMKRIVLLWILGLTQGVLGWYMVHSGLIEDPMVSPYRLAAHLTIGFLILWIILWMVLELRSASKIIIPIQMNKNLLHSVYCTLAALIITMIFGAFVAGLKAGLIYNTFPLMNARWLPDNMWGMSPFWINIFENAGTVQFLHRIFAIITFFLVVNIVRESIKIQLPSREKWLIYKIILVVIGQVCLGITTLIMHVPTHVASAHQTGALVLFSLLLWLTYNLRAAMPGKSLPSSHSIKAPPAVDK
jgi:cytochrome c oxidase assembly protein subunit 15